MTLLSLSDFSGGLNLRDAPNEIALNETADAYNFQLDFRGGLKYRPGHLAQIAMPAGVRPLRWSALLNLWLALGVGPIYKRPADFSGSWVTPTGGATCYIEDVVDWPGTTPLVVGVGSTNGAYTYDGTTVVQVAPTIRCGTVEVWGNRVWAGKYWSNDGVGHTARLFASKVGDPTDWIPSTAVDDALTVDLRIKDAEGITALALAGDVLLVFKKNSTYRITDPTTGEPHLIDPNHGALSPNAVVSQRGRVYAWGERGIFEYDGIGPGKLISDKVRPLTVKGFTGYTSPDVYAGAFEDRLVFAYPTIPNSVTTQLLEGDPLHGWWMQHLFGGTAGLHPQVHNLVKKDNDLYMVASLPDFTNAETIYKVFGDVLGYDNGQGFVAHYRTPWLQPAKGKRARLIRALVEGALKFQTVADATTVTLNVYRDWNFGSPALATYALAGDLAIVNSPAELAESIANSIGHGRSFAFEFQVSRTGGVAALDSATIAAINFEPVQLEG